MDTPKQDLETLHGTIAVDTDTFASSPPVDPLVYIFSDAIKQAMESFAAAHQRSMVHMAALVAAVDKISMKSIVIRGGMSNARGKDGSLKKVNNILIKSMMPLMRVVDKLYLADTTEAEAPSMKVVFDSCMTSLSLLNEANLEVETLRRDAFKPTTHRIYKSLISKPGVSKTLLFEEI